MYILYILYKDLHQIFIFTFEIKCIHPTAITHRICNEGKSLKILIGSSFIKLQDRSLQKRHGHVKR